jgi:hypothetical protein
MRKIPKRKIAFFISVNFLLILPSTSSAFALIPSGYPTSTIPAAGIPNQSTSPSPTPSPSPGPSPTPSSHVEKAASFTPMDLLKPAATVLQVSIANRATGTPGILEGPRQAVANIGGYGQIAPTIATIVKNNLPTVAFVLRGLLQFGASS